jgi:signal peptidase II
MTTTNHRRTGLIIAGIVFAIDQVIKYVVTHAMALDYEGASHYFLPFFQFTLTHNEGVALGLFAAGSDTARWVLTGLLGVITAGVGTWLWREQNRGDALGLSLVLGGALGNLVDRARLGYVIDFADLHFGDFRPFLVFNVADAAITVGVLILLARALFTRESKIVVES